MALGATIYLRASGAGINSDQDAQPVIPVSILSDWTDINTDLKTADNTGSTVTNPGAITRADVHPLGMRGLGTTVQLRMKYNTAQSVSTSPVVQMFGFDTAGVDTGFTSACCPERLVDINGSHELTLASDSADARHTVDSVTWAYSATKEVDANAAAYIMGVVKTAAVQTTHTPILQVRVK